MKKLCCMPWILLVSLFIVGCAPQSESESKAAEAEAGTADTPQIIATPDHQTDYQSSPQPGPQLDTQSLAEASPVDQPASADIDWSQRYNELYSYYYPLFPEPETGRAVEVRAASGQLVQGVVRSLTAEQMVFDLGDRQVTLSPERLHPSSAYDFFPDVFASYHARKQAVEEYQRWKEVYGSAEDSDRIATSVGAQPQPTPWRIPPQSDDPMFPIEPYK